MRAGSITALQGTTRLQQRLPFHLYSAVFIGCGPVSARDGEGQSETGAWGGLKKVGTHEFRMEPPQSGKTAMSYRRHTLLATHATPTGHSVTRCPCRVCYKRPSRQAEMCASQVVRRPRPGDGQWEARSHTYLTCEEIMLGQTHPISPESAW